MVWPAPERAAPPRKTIFRVRADTKKREKGIYQPSNNDNETHHNGSGGQGQAETDDGSERGDERAKPKEKERNKIDKPTRRRCPLLARLAVWFGLVCLGFDYF